MDARGVCQKFELNAALLELRDAKQKINYAMGRVETGLPRSPADLDSLRRTVTSATVSLSCALSSCRRFIYAVGCEEDRRQAGRRRY